jgi:poly-gamma-glutamate synthesis protein (capsule biosynthesis protein)
MPIKQPARFFLSLCVLALIFPSCTSQAVEVPQVIVNSPVPPTITPTAKNEISTSAFTGVIFGDSVPQGLQELIYSYEIPFSTSINVDVAKQDDQDVILFEWIYVLVAPFPTVTDGVTFDDIRSKWNDGTPLSTLNLSPLLMADSTLRVFTAIWGEPATGSVRSVDEDQLLDTAWTESAWAIVPFESLDPKWKVLTVDGQSPIRKDFDAAQYPLVVVYSMGPASVVDASSWRLSNYDPSKLTTVIMTGVTALVRATALTMELKGSAYPGEKIRDLFREADIAHVSNEIPFFTGCSYPKPDAGALVFCSDPKYMGLLTDIGTDVIELTGNHFADYGPFAMYETLDIYRANNIPYFGGGQDLQDSLKPALFEVNGNKIAFIGCNRPDVGRFPTATDYQPGAAPCDFEYLPQKINQLNAEGYVVISTFQWNESYDSYPAPEQKNEFRLMADSGASIVSGSQAHYAQMMEFYDGAFIHYGLGNLFFDQMGDQDWMPPGIRREFLDRYVIYDDELVSVELITAMLEDYSRPRIMTDEERAGFLQEYFYYSGWAPLIPTPTPVITPTLTPMSIP